MRYKWIDKINLLQIKFKRKISSNIYIYKLRDEFDEERSMFFLQIIISGNTIFLSRIENNDIGQLRENIERGYFPLLTRVYLQMALRFAGIGYITYDIKNVKSLLLQFISWWIPTLRFRVSLSREKKKTIVSHLLNSNHSNGASFNLLKFF